MEVITMDSKVYKDLVGKIQRIADFVAKAQVMPKEENEVWLDSNQVADALNISTRTLQRLRNENLISYSMLRGRCLYKLSEIERGLNERIIKCKPQDRENFRRNYFLNDNENKVQAVKLAKKIGAVKAANELQIPVNTLYGWIRKVKIGSLDIGCGERSPEESLNIAEENQQLRKRIKALEKENKRLSEMNEFLEDAAAFFAASRQKSGKNKG